jgi:NTP pyrophosphatase (non-canonical NTP hydrolase)
MEQLIRDWAHARNLIAGSTQQAQMLKLTEEVGELARGIAKSQLYTVKDAIGDCGVVLTILAAQHGLTLHQCLEAAYEQIKDRKGQMVNGVFVKDKWS